MIPVVGAATWMVCLIPKGPVRTEICCFEYGGNSPGLSTRGFAVRCDSWAWRDTANYTMQRILWTTIRCKSGVSTGSTKIKPLGPSCAGSAWSIVLMQITDFCCIERAIVYLYVINVAFPVVFNHPVDPDFDLFPIWVKGGQAVVVNTAFFFVCGTWEHVVDTQGAVDVEGRRIVICILDGDHVRPVIPSNGSSI